MAERIAFLVQSGAGGPPLASATPSVLMYKSKAGVGLTPPTIINIGSGMYGFVATDADVAAGAAYLIDTGAFPRYVAGAAHNEAQPFAALFFTDGAGALWTGAAPTVGLYSDLTPSARAAPTPLALYGQSFYVLVPTFADVQAATAYRVDAPAGSAQTYYTGAFSLPVSAVGAFMAEAVRAALVADATVLSLVGTRIYPNKRPQNVAFPVVVYNLVSQVTEHTLGDSMQTRLKHHRLQIDSYAQTYAAAHQLAIAVENVVGNLSTADIAGWKTGERDLYDDATSMHRVMSEFTISTG